MSRLMLNVSRLRVLTEVARRGSFSAAAAALSYTQSAVSQQIASLEAETGVTLLERHPRGVRPTTAGKRLVEQAEGILAQLQSAESELAAIAGLRGGQLRLASFPTAGATLMPLAIVDFRARHPDVELTLAEGEPEEIAPRLHAGELDLALLFEFGEAQAATGRREDLNSVHLLHDPMYLALPGEHPLATRDAVRIQDLSGEAWVQTSRSSACARYVVRLCHTAGFEPKVSFESDDYQTVQGLVAAGVGVALIPELALSGARDDIVIKALSPRPPIREVLASVPRGARLAPAAPAMLNSLEHAAEGYEAQRPAGYTPPRPAGARREGKSTSSRTRSAAS
jgi:DNA-binding transcriptional LysR family regulator